MMHDHRFLSHLRSQDLLARTGRVRKILPTLIEADGPSVPLGTLCTIAGVAADGSAAGTLTAEVVRVDRDAIVLVPLEAGQRVQPGAIVTACAYNATVAVGDALLGRVIDPLGRPLEGRPLYGAVHRALDGGAPSPMARTSPMRIVETGIRAIDGLLTLGHGQRVGLFAASGVGKTSLVSQLARQVDVDRCVICLVGERGREVEALWTTGLTDAVRARTTVVAATSDETAAMRVRAGSYAVAIAEHWRAQGKHVLLLLDSVTRLAMAMREMGLAAGEPPTVRAYTPSVFAAIPALVERCGALRSGGAITAIMTVLSETDDIDDPICELMKSLLDGHIILSRDLAGRGQFPAIDVPASVSRQAHGLVNDEARADAIRAVQLLSVYASSKALIEAGIYSAGSNAEIDAALAKRSQLIGFLGQRASERSSYQATLAALAAIVGSGS